MSSHPCSEPSGIHGNPIRRRNPATRPSLFSKTGSSTIIALVIRTAHRASRPQARDFADSGHGYQLRTGIVVEVDISPDFSRLPPEAEVTLFRVIQESLTNVHRYSGSPKAYVSLRTMGSEIKVQVKDFGKGMRTDVLKSSQSADAPLGVGIQGMKERMRQLSGRLDIASRPHEGTLVTATLPISGWRLSPGNWLLLPNLA